MKTGDHAMKSAIRLVTPLVAALIVCASASPASAQFGFGYGFGLYNPNDGSQTTGALNQQALMQGQAAYANRPRPGVEPSFQQRDDNFYNKYDLATREAMIDRVARNPGLERSAAYAGGSIDRPAAPAPTPAVRAPTPSPVGPPIAQVVRLGNFFDKQRKLVWPSESPTTNDFGPKRQAAELAAQTVLNEYQSRGIATLESTASARRQLLDYGRPALVYVGEHSTPAITDSFHAYLLTLYADLGDAYTVPASKGR